jgi:spore coat polysaccharide biosynthesis predicted glycosyltransferase SpsG
MPAEGPGRARSDLVFRADTEGTGSFGHVRRCHALAARLREAGVQSTFLVRGDGPGREWLAARGERTHVLGACVDEPTAVVREARRCRAPVVALGVSQPVSQRYVMTLRRAGRAVVLLDNDGPGRLAAHLSVSPASPPSQTWRGALGEHVASPAYAILGEPFRPQAKAAADAPPTVLATMGGYDTDGTTLTALAALEEIGDPMRCVIVVGPGFQHHEKLRLLLSGANKPYEVHYNVPEMAPLVAAADVAVAGFGMAAYELAAAGVPAVLVLRDRGQRWHAEQFAAAGAAVVVGPDASAIADALQPLVIGSALRRRFSLAAERLVDGRGTERVAELVCGLARRAGGNGGRRGTKGAAGGGRSCTSR